MSIEDAKNPKDWQIGFEDGILFAMKIKVSSSIEPQAKCDHSWINSPLDMAKRCSKCGITINGY